MIVTWSSTRQDTARGPLVGLPAGARRVAVLVESSHAVGRGIVAGISRAARPAGWSLELESGRLGEGTPPWFRRWRGDGVIVRLAGERAAEAIGRRGLPTVDVAGAAAGTQLPHVRFDDQAIGRMAAEHLLDRGFRTLAFCGIAGLTWSADRERGLRAAAGDLAVAESFRFDRLVSRWTAPSTLLSRLAGWLAALPRPVGVVACDDVRGAMVLEACRLAGLAVPDAVAVVGVDDDRSLCQTADPTLSSVVVDAARAGELAVGLLERLLDGSPPPRGHRGLVVPPLRVECRRSSDAFALDDPHVAAVLRMVRGGDLRHQSVAKLVAASGLPRRTLLRRCQEQLGHSLHEELIRARLARAERLLIDTTLPIAEVAARAGFNYPEYLGRVFLQRHGCSPGDFRRGGGGRGRGA